MDTIKPGAAPTTPGVDSSNSRPPKEAGPQRDRPSLSLPTAGGAVRGMGEKFAANPLTGTASLTVPIAVTAARAGGTPELSLTYDSGGGNGPFGLGWSLELPSVTRRTDKGVPRYVDDGPQADVFQLSGAEDLVPVPGTATYRPRTEGLSSRIERIEEQRSGVLTWRVTTTENTVSVFGSTDASRVSDPNDPGRVYRWLLDETIDERGNRIRYDYQADGAQRYLKRVRYGNRTATGDFCFEVVLDYGEHDQARPTPDESGQWTTRPDAFSVRRSGFELRTKRLCSRVLMFHRLPELGTDPVLVASTDFEHALEPASTKLTSVTHFGYLTSEDGYSRERLPPLRFGYTPRVVAPVQGDLIGAPEENGYRWTDLDGEGIPGVLSEQAGAWYYRPNLGGGVLAPPRAVDPLPSGGRLNKGARLGDLAGDGRQTLAAFDGTAPGYHRRTSDRNWTDFSPFDRLPQLDWNDSNLRFVDLTGDGLADLLQTSSDGFTWFPSLGLRGYDDSFWQPAARTEDHGPRLVFADLAQSIYLADMTGDGLTDLVRIGNGEIGYWPNLGHGRFGGLIRMAAAPVFDHPDKFDQRRVRLADVDGSAPTDLLYLGEHGIRVWFNQAGNSWSAPELLGWAGVTEPDSVQLVDLLGTGTACLVRAEQRPDGEPPVRYLDLMAAGKPHLMTTVTSGMGLTTTVRYRSSTTFALADAAAGRPWLTHLPFPVLVVADTTVEDEVADTRLVTSYRYRHGFYDGAEREFRGFAYVEQRDALSFSGSVDRLYQLPAVVKRWQHTGWYPDADQISRQFLDEYWRSGAGPLLQDTIIPEGLSVEEEREVVRALRGHALREEVFTEDEDGRLGNPYTVTETNYRLRLLQPKGDAPYGVVIALPGETITAHTERHSDDPRIAHTVALDVDDWGNVLQSVTIAYPRRTGDDPEQARQYLTLSEHDIVNVSGATGPWRIGIGAGSRTYELGGLPRHADIFTAQEISDGLAIADDLRFQDEVSGSVPQRRLLSRTRQTYYASDLSTELGSEEVSFPLLPYRSYEQVFDSGQVPLLYGDRVSDTLLIDAGYVEAQGLWWTPSGRNVFDPARFYLPTSSIDPFGSTWQVGYDRHLLRQVRFEDPLGNVNQAELNYRVLQAWLLTDPNLNQSAVRFDHLGMVVATALLGKGEGDSLDLSTAEASAADRPSTWLTYDLGVRPVVVRTFARELHAKAGPIQESKAFSDGTGRTILTKVQAEPATDGAPRWIGTGRTIYDNKGNPVKKYEPYFAADSGFDTEPAMVQSGVTTILRYDALSRLIGTDYPDGTFSKVVFDAWDREDWDRNDTVLDSQWYASRAVLPVDDPRRQAADSAAGHAGTPTRSSFDTLGHAHVVRADNGTGFLETTVDRDVQGNERSTTDPRGLRVLEQRFDMLGRVAHSISPDSGQRWLLADVAGSPAHGWDDRGTTTRVRYDRLHRPTHSYAGTVGGPEILRLLTVYGERTADAITHNLRTRPAMVFDGAGLQRTAEIDFKGNTLIAERRLAIDPRSEPDWTDLENLSEPDDVLSTADALLEDVTYRTSTTFDALNRPSSSTNADGSRTRLHYNAGKLLETVETRSDGAAAWTPVVTNIDYNARGERVQLVRGNGARTVYGYEPDTFRLSSVDTTATDSVIQTLRYTYDPVGNVVQVADPSQDTVFYRNTAVGSTRSYRYDPVYRLSSASGREHIGQTGQPAAADLDFGPLPHANDGTALREYTETYRYDPSGNLTELAHLATAGSWTRQHLIDASSNRLVANSIPGDDPGTFSARYTYDAAGNTLTMPHLPSVDWDVENRLVHAGLGGGGDAHYQYDGSGHRIRATVTRAGATETRIYLGSVELYVKQVGQSARVRRETLRAADGVALIETTTVDDGRPVANPVPLRRFQLTDHLGSATVELDDSSNVLSYEEYHPFGTTSFHSAPRNNVSRKRYRYTGKERDEETGFYYHGARYYAPWLARWTIPDPAGLVDGPGRYSYARNNPVRLVDPTGLEGDDPQRWLSQSRPYWQEVTATGATRGITDGHRANLVKATQIWGGPDGKIQAGHLGTPFVITRAGEKGFVFAQNGPENARDAKGDKAIGNAARGAGQFARTNEVDLTVAPRTRYGVSPDSPAFLEPGFKDFKLPAGPTAPNEGPRGQLRLPFDPEVFEPKQGPAGPSPQLELPFEKGLATKEPAAPAAPKPQQLSLPSAKRQAVASASQPRSSGMTATRAGNVGASVARTVPLVAEAEIATSTAAVYAHALGYTATGSALTTAAAAVPVAGAAVVTGAAVGNLAEAFATQRGASQPTAQAAGVVSAALAGAGVGALVGSAAGGIGALPGAAVGAAFGMGAYYLSKMW
ncbi:hypothetical protein E1263_00480 [Kribbella antibiotica]|uniref:Sugar-binding protein n=1 Tax=Kribbella antibiotica TaxID=190195 RepID=A0A4R5A1Y0_9ACTN|nr:SpvB/TcaC N-terminal domain-containing protein [Kribbella antibiotica]TDD63462.1 hypothetical protein E1263_00480 [Kribbella antibiotica]